MQFPGSRVFVCRRQTRMSMVAVIWALSNNVAVNFRLYVTSLQGAVLGQKLKSG
jgi:hypothetical protein